MTTETIPPPTMGEMAADYIASKVGSWPFLIIQNCMFVVWMSVNVLAVFMQWDPYPFILLNLVLSFQAAETGPILLISANRAAQRDRNTILMFKAEFEDMAEDHGKLHKEHRDMHEDHKVMHAEMKTLLKEAKQTHKELIALHNELIDKLTKK